MNEMVVLEIEVQTGAVAKELSPRLLATSYTPEV